MNPAKALQSEFEKLNLSPSDGSKVSPKRLQAAQPQLPVAAGQAATNSKLTGLDRVVAALKELIGELSMQ